MSGPLGSNYPNPLDNFRTYSYHYIMTVANTTEAFRKMIQPVNGKARVLSAVESASLGDKIDIDGESAYLLLDTRRFSQYSIIELEMEHIYGTGNRVNPSVPATSTRVKLIDTTGLTFFNFLADTLRNKLKTTRASAFFLLSIIFIGHKDDGTTETVAITNIPLILLLMAFEFTSSGSVYDIEFMESEGAPQLGQALEHINSLYNVNSVTTQGGPPTVGQMILNLEKRLNIQSLQYFQKYTNDAFNASSTDGNTNTNDVKFGKLVQYMITLPDKHPFNWANDFKVTTALPSKREEQMFIAKANAQVEQEKTKNPYSEEEKQQKSDRYYELSFSNTTTITDAIKKILESSPQFLKLASQEAIKSGNGYTFKTVTNITTNHNTYLIHIDIYPVKIPKPISKDQTSTNKNPSALRNLHGVKNVITYDYIFTGFNSHIKDLRIQYLPESAIALDTEVDIGGNRFATNASQGNTVDDVKKVAKGRPTSKDFAPILRPNDPIFPPIQTKDQIQNNNSQSTEDIKREDAVAVFKAKQEYTRTLAYMHFISSLNLDMIIRGNPNILEKYAGREERGGIAPHGEIIDTPTLEKFYRQTQTEAESNYLNYIAGRLSSAKAQYYSEYYGPRLQKLIAPSNPQDDTLLNGADVATSPIFIKINILAPNVDFTGQYKKGELMFTDEFFFKGLYMIIFIKHHFAEGEFYQSLNLIPFDVTGSFSESRDNDNSQLRRTV
jgi:hypothetical protein